MTKRYISKLDSKSFPKKSDLINHLLDQYSMEDNKEGMSNEVLKKLTDAFPFAKIDIEELDELSKYGDFSISMDWPDYDGDFRFYIGKPIEESYYDYHFNTIDEAIKHYNKILNTGLEIKRLLATRYEPEEITIDQMYDGRYDMYDSSPGILYNFMIGGKMYSERYHLGTDIEAFVDSFKGHFENVVEGVVGIEKDYSTSSDVEYYVDNVPLSTLIKRAKRMRIEIIEVIDEEIK